ncbi:unnamed protein product [Polarella glacialis]|uniref:Uncharacterized protein n=1 Tax=Polarella glacialis TaxID=89957 RepID=A0A813JFQ0_POLGL|nr:unnamed protein product [Polarella glacialis]
MHESQAASAVVFIRAVMHESQGANVVFSFLLCNGSRNCKNSLIDEGHPSTRTQKAAGTFIKQHRCEMGTTSPLGPWVDRFSWAPLIPTASSEDLAGGQLPCLEQTKSL